MGDCTRSLLECRMRRSLARDSSASLEIRVALWESASRTRFRRKRVLGFGAPSARLMFTQLARNTPVGGAKGIPDGGEAGKSVSNVSIASGFSLSFEHARGQVIALKIVH